jgi:murein DD-endopeptidase / murein LD-carboxypeptidase
MHSRAAAIVAAVRGCVGTRFRVQGRLPGVGLDCLGVVQVAARAAGAELPDADGYDLRGGGMLALDAALAAAMRRVAVACPGDVLLVAPGARLRHLGVVTDLGIVHAHAGLRRVVEGPPGPDWVRLGAFRFWE